jgi:hypothetical protein
MNILDAVAIRLPCRSCGDNYRVPLKDVLLSHRMLHQGCPVSQETDALHSSNHDCLNART